MTREVSTSKRNSLSEPRISTRNRLRLGSRRKDFSSYMVSAVGVCDMMCTQRCSQWSLNTNKESVGSIRDKKAGEGCGDMVTRCVKGARGGKVFLLPSITGDNMMLHNMMLHKNKTLQSVPDSDADEYLESAVFSH